MFIPLQLMLRRIIRSGDVVFVDAGGTRHVFGDGSGTPVRVRLADRRLERQLVRDPELAAGQGYIDGRLIVEEGSVYDFIDVMMRNVADHPLPAWSQTFARARHLRRRWDEFNPMARSRRNVAHHYDIDPRIYDLFLDTNRQYSCAYFTPGADLEAAQAAKLRHIAAKLDLKPGLKVLDIGSGWGGLARYLAGVGGSDVTGITLSEEQLKFARGHAVTGSGSGAGLVRFELADYRSAAGQYDRIVSVGMFEHVGVLHYKTFFENVARLLKDDGVALIHAIGRSDAPAPTNPFIAKYVFPGGSLAALSEVMGAIEGTGIYVTDVEILRLHYAETLRAWRERFLAKRASAVEIAGEAFARMWEFYLAGCEAAFRYQHLMVFQIQLAKKVDGLPTLRDYMFEAERRLAAKDRGSRQPLHLAGE